MTAVGFLVASLALFVLLAYVGARAWLWTAGAAFVLAWLSLGFDMSRAAEVALSVAFIAVAGALNLRRLRRRLISDRVLALYKRILPPMSQTEREAISGKSQEQLAQTALAAGIITARAHAHLQRTAKLRDEVIRVDDFPQDFGCAKVALPAAHKAAA